MYMCTVLQTQDKQCTCTFTILRFLFVSVHTYQLICPDLLVCGTLTVSGMLLIYWNCICLFSWLWSWVTDHSCQISVVTCKKPTTQHHQPKNKQQQKTLFYQHFNLRPVLKISPMEWSFCMKISQESQLGNKWFSFHLHLIFSEQFFYTSAIYQLPSLSGTTSISDALKMI